MALVIFTSSEAEGRQGGRCVEEGKNTCLLKAQHQRDMGKRTKELQGSSTWKERARAQPEQDRWEYTGPMEGPEKYHGDIRV